MTAKVQIKHKDMLLSAEQVGMLLGVTRYTVYRQAKSGAIPMPIEVNGIKKWQYGQVLKWLDYKNSEVNPDWDN